MLKTDPVFTIIAKTEPFSELASPNMQALAGLCRMRRYAKGEIIFHMGEPGDALYGIKSGRVRTTILSPDGREMTFNLFGPQATFGVVGFLDGGIRAHPEVALHVIDYLCAKLRSIKERVGETALLPLAASLAHRLLTLAEEFGDEIPASQEQLASFVSASRESVNRQLQQWKRQKIVSLHRGGLNILDHARLEQEATVLGA
jgi:CRP/FNR family cyclic AMP-dependent transcriptional regulator